MHMYSICKLCRTVHIKLKITKWPVSKFFYGIDGIKSSLTYYKIFIISNEKVSYEKTHTHTHTQNLLILYGGGVYIFCRQGV